MSNLDKRYNGLWGENFFRDLFDFPYEMRRSDLMKTDVREVDGNYILNIEIPGFSKEDLNVSLEEGYLTVSAKKENVREDKDSEGRFIRRERYLGNCSRSYYVGDIREEDIKAKYEQGVLMLSFPKEDIKRVEEKKRISIE